MLNIDNAKNYYHMSLLSINVIAFEQNDSIDVIYCNDLNPKLFNELQRFLGPVFNLIRYTDKDFNDLLTSNFTNDEDSNNDIAEELDDSFDLEEFAGTINATEDLLSGNNDAPIIKLINGIISKAIKRKLVTFTLSHMRIS